MTTTIEGGKITITNQDIYSKALRHLKEAYGEDAEFRPGQYEAIEAVFTNRRTLVVQKTGWGKSLVYFISAKMTEGVTLVVSPLLVLMDNQREAGERLGLSCVLLNSRLKGDEREEAFEQLKNGEIDIAFTTPETLNREDMRMLLPQLQIGLFVIDECHCISDWGHDFRLEYGMLNRVIQILPESVPVLGTTATANDRVIEDLKKQFGENVYVSRGPLTRESLHIEILKMGNKAERYAWIGENLRRLPGTGIIYCLTQRDCEKLSAYLNDEGYTTRPYHSGNDLEKEDPITGISPNQETEELLKNNQIKAVVATIKLGMGYDKRDIGFIIHFQRPSSLVSYYQQIGRAGRTPGMEAYCYLMTGDEDRKIQEYFIENAFPTEQQERDVISALEEQPDGLNLLGLQNYSNISSAALMKCLLFLVNQGVIYRDDDTKRYYRSPVAYTYQGDHYDEVKQAKYRELDALDRFVEETGCLSRYVVNQLNDYTAGACGKCMNCLNGEILEGVNAPEGSKVEAVRDRILGDYIPIEPRKKWAEKENGFDKSTRISKPNMPGYALAKYGDSGFGEMVAHDKYHADMFREELVDRAASILTDRIDSITEKTVTFIPSSRNEKVKDFAERLAAKLGCRFEELIIITGKGDHQKKMQNSVFQYRNAKEKLQSKEGVDVPKEVILVDDIVDSKWTMTVGGGLLSLMGVECVYPIALADSSVRED